MSLQHIGVVGAGQMGSGIAQVFAQAGFQVTLVDTEERFLARGMETIQKSLTRFVQKGTLSLEEKESTLSRIKTTVELTELSQVELVVEAIIEQMEAKTKLFAQLDQICPEATILASNTSSLPITEIAAVTKRPAQVIGMHFMNPVPVMKLVEIIRGLSTSDEVYETIHQLTEKLGKHPVEVQDFPGFVSNRILMPMINEAIFSVYEGVATPAAVDAVMKLGMNHPMGPLQLADMIGLDTCLYIMETLQEGFGDSKYRPCPLLRKYVKAGWLGRKSGRGFYQYS